MNLESKADREINLLIHSGHANRLLNLSDHASHLLRSLA
jgi:hypothetical protein